MIKYQADTADKVRKAYASWRRTFPRVKPGSLLFHAYLNIMQSLYNLKWLDWFQVQGSGLTTFEPMNLERWTFFIDALCFCSSQAGFQPGTVNVEPLNPGIIMRICYFEKCGGTFQVLSVVKTNRSWKEAEVIVCRIARLSRFRRWIFKFRPPSNKDYGHSKPCPPGNQGNICSTYSPIRRLRFREQ